MKNVSLAKYGRALWATTAPSPPSILEKKENTKKGNSSAKEKRPKVGEYGIFTAYPHSRGCPLYKH